MGWLEREGGRGKREREREREREEGAAGKVGRVYLLFRFRMFPFIFFFNLIKPVRFGPVQSV